MGKILNTVCPLSIIGRGFYKCDTDCTLYYNNECLLKTYLLSSIGERTKKVEEEIKKLQKDLQFTGLFGGLTMDCCAKGSGPNGN